jgi:hypothetical protein
MPKASAERLKSIFGWSVTKVSNTSWLSDDDMNVVLLRSLRLRSGGHRHGEESERGRCTSNLLFPQ